MNTSEKMIEALLEHVTPGSLVLEPSAGKGLIVARLVYEKNCEVVAIELNKENYKILKDPLEKECEILNMDFFNVGYDNVFDHVVAVPPYKDNVDCQHIMKMYRCTKKGGTVVTFTLPTWITGMYSNQREFREWLADKDYTLKIFEEPESYLGCPKMLLIIRK